AMNMIQSAKDQIAVLTRSAYRAAVQEGLLPDGVETVPAVEIPKDTANGDYTTTFCLAASKAMRKNPREVANILTRHMKLDGTYFTSVEIAGPGFLNFRLGEKWYADVVEDVEREADAYGRGEGLQGKKDEDIDKLDLKDDVLRRANGFYTYFAGDIAYHRNKFAVRHFDKVINIWGADHHGHVARMKGAMDALGLDGTNRLDIVLMQLVKLVRDGEVVRMSKRTGKTISLSDLLDEIPVDACRYFFNAKPDTQMEFDLGLAVREDSENPIYYIQYAHARICSLLKALEEEGHSVKPGAVDLSILSSDAEHALIKELSSFAEEIRMAARDYDPSYINRYLMRLAAAFHKFYNACRIKGEDEAVIDARLKLASATRQVLANGLKVIGCSAPEKM
ncbi:MAG: arginine--tRNA ligase, partial [Parolsenella sp.]|uniref:arginine--tRNA ligase n=1 Tax=Parolsenella sp. TaxID=2083006 RepID=UPI002E7A300B